MMQFFQFIPSRGGWAAGSEGSLVEQLQRRFAMIQSPSSGLTATFSPRAGRRTLGATSEQSQRVQCTKQDDAQVALVKPVRMPGGFFKRQPVERALTGRHLRVDLQGIWIDALRSDAGRGMIPAA